jgi:hypothetical protein
MIRDEPQHIALNGISVLVSTSDGQTISSLAEIRESMSANFKFGLIDGRIPMSGPFKDSELGTISGVCAMDVEW